MGGVRSGVEQDIEHRDGVDEASMELRVFGKLGVLDVVERDPSVREPCLVEVRLGGWAGPVLVRFSLLTDRDEAVGAVGGPLMTPDCASNSNPAGSAGTMP